MKIGKEPTSQTREQVNIDFRSKEEKKEALRAKIIRERKAGNFSTSSYSQEEQMLIAEIVKEESEDDKDYYHIH